MPSPQQYSPTYPVPRRRVLGLGMAALAGLAACSPGRTEAAPSRSARPASHTPSPTAGTAHRVDGSFTSAARNGATCGWTIAYPAAPAGRALRPLIVLHGWQTTHADVFDHGLHLDQVLNTVVAAGTHPFAVAAVDGGDTFWHRRRSGGDSGAMLLNEFIPLLAQRGLDTSRVALMGWSMGGYGSILLAPKLGASKVAAVVAESPALWHRADQTATGAFDDADDFNANNVFGRQQQLAGIPLRVDCGTDDGFCPATRDYIADLSPHPAGGFTPGGHDMNYWRGVAAAQLTFVGAHLPA